MNILKQGQIVFPELFNPPRAKTPPGRSRLVFGIARRPGNARVFLVSFLMYLIGFFPSFVFALPTGGSVQAGSVSIDQPSAEQMVIRQSTDKAIIDWRSFGIGSAEHVDFRLPSADGVTLNRVTGNQRSDIFGHLSSNGNLMLINPNGILFGDGARIDVHGLVATTSNLSNENFLAGNYNFNIPSAVSGVVVNRGQISVKEGGLVALVAPGVINDGIINARLGRVSLASGNTFTLDLYGDQLVNLGVDSRVLGQVTGLDGETLASLVTNSGKIFADGGTVRLDVNAAQGVVDNVINMSGVIQARSVMEREGTIVLMGGTAGQVRVSGILDASGYETGRLGGTVHVLGEKVGLFGNALVDVSGDTGGGTLLFGGDYQGMGSVPNAWETYVAPEASIYADAITFGDGGRAIFWADRRTRFLGRMRARGGRESGNGGFVEVSGKEELFFDGLVDTTAPNGKTGTLLLDPENIIIADGSGSTASGTATFTFFETTLEANSATTNISLFAEQAIIIQNLSDNLLDLKQTSGHSVTFTARLGRIDFEDSNDVVRTAGGDIIFSAGDELAIGSLISNGGEINLRGTDLSLFGVLNAGTGDVVIQAAQIGTKGGLTGLAGASADTSTLCGGAACDLTLDSTELKNITAANLIIGTQSFSGLNTSGDIYIDGLSAAETANISSSVQINVAHVSGSDGKVVFNNDSVFSRLTVNAVNGVEVNGNLATSSGDLSLNGDWENVFDTSKPDNNNIFLASGITLTAAKNLTLSATTNGITAAGAVTLIAGSGLTINNSFTATGSATLNAATGMSFGSNIAVTSGGTLSLSAGGSMSAAGALTLKADNGLALSSSLTAAGDLVLDGTDSITLASGVSLVSTGGSITLDASTSGISAAGGATLTAASGVALNDSFTAAGAVTIDADSNDDGTGDFTLVSGKTLATGNNALSITANDITLNGSISSGTAGTTIAVSDGGSMGLGSTTCGGSCGMSIDSTEFSKITQGSLTLAANAIVIASGESLSTAGQLILGAAGGTITGEGTLSLSAGDGLTLNSSVTATGDLFLEGDSDNTAGSNDKITLASGVSLTALGGDLTLDATTGGISAAGAATLASVNDITLNDNFTAAGAVTVDADSNGAGAGDFTLVAGKTLSTGNNALSITANQIVLNGSVSSGAAATTLLVSDGGTIGLGDTAGDWTISGSELQRITAAGLTIGDGSNGSITIDNITSANSGNISGTVTLNATSAGFLNNASVFGSGLAVNAANGVTLGANVTTSGSTSLNSDSDADGNGDLTIAAALNSNNNSISLTGADLVLTGSIDSGTAGTSAGVSKAGSSIGLGTATGDMTIDATELGLITAGSRTIGGSANGGINVDTLTFSNPLTLLATRSGSSVAFAGASSFGDLTVNAGGSITDTGSLTVSGTSSFTGAQGITLDSAANSFAGTVSLNTGANAALVASSALTLGTSTIGGDMSVTAGGGISIGTSNIGGNMGVTAGGGIAVNGVQTAGGTISLAAANDITLLGSLVTGSSSSTAVNLTSTGGGVFDGDLTGDLDIDAAAGGLVVDVVSGFGTDLNAIETRVASVDIDNTTSGEVNIFESDSLSVINITQSADPGNVFVSYFGNLSGEENATALFGSVTFFQRDVRNQLVPGTGKTLGDLSLETTTNLANHIESSFSMAGGNFFPDNKTVASGLSGPVFQAFVADVFSENFGLFEVAQSGGANRNLRGFSDFWGPLKAKDTELVKRRTRKARRAEEARRRIERRRGPLKKAEAKPAVRAKTARAPDRGGIARDKNKSLSLFQPLSFSFF